MLLAFAVTVGTNLRYLRRYRKVRTRSTPKWVEWALGLWSAVALFSIGFLLDGTIRLLLHAGGHRGSRAVPALGRAAPAYGMTAHPRARLDDLVHQPVRFSLLAGLAQADELEFRFLRDTLQISDSLLSRQASTLEQAGYIAIRKGHVGKWPRTWLSSPPKAAQRSTTTSRRCARSSSPPTSASTVLGLFVGEGAAHRLGVAHRLAGHDLADPLLADDHLDAHGVDQVAAGGDVHVGDQRQPT